MPRLTDNVTPQGGYDYSSLPDPGYSLAQTQVQPNQPQQPAGILPQFMAWKDSLAQMGIEKLYQALAGWQQYAGPRTPYQNDYRQRK